MNSFNHYAYGAIGDWMVRTVAGLDLDESAPAYKHILIHPQPGGGLTSARAELMTLYGSAVSGWKLEDGRMSLTVRVPPNTRGTVRLPGAMLAQTTEGTREVATAPGITSAVQRGSDVVVEVGSGEYVFAYRAATPAPAAPVSGVRQ